MADSPNHEADLSAVENAEAPSSKAIVDLANHLLKEFNIPTRIEDVCDITASLFVVLYESLFSDRLPGIIRQPVSKEDEVHNCQIVIDVLSMEVVKDSLSHIRGSDIVAGDNTAILNLLDIFSYLLEYVVKRIENEADVNDTGSVCTTEPEQDVPSRAVASPKKLKDLPKSKLGSTATSNTTNNNGAHLQTSGKSKECTDRNENRKAFPPRDVITHEDFYAMSYGGISLKDDLARPPSPIRPDTSQSLLGQRTIDSDFDTDLDKPERKTHDTHRNQPKVAWEAKSSRDAKQPEAVIDGVTLRAHTQPAKDAPWESSAYSSERPIPSFSASMPAPRDHKELHRADPLRATVGPIPYSAYTTPRETEIESARSLPVKGLSSSYSDLRDLVEKTAALTRVALATSPVRARTALDLDVTDIERERPRPVISSKGARLAKELNAKSLSSAYKRQETSPEKPGKKVAFASLRDSGVHDYDHRGDYRSALPSGWSVASPRGYASDLELDLVSSGSSPARGRQPSASGQRKQAKSKPGGQKKTSSSGSRQQLAKYLAQSRQPELGAAQMTLKTEDRAIRRKQEILRKFYEQDHQDFAEDVEYLLERDKQRSKELEEECVKKLTQGPAKKKVVKTGKAQAPKKPRISKPATSKPKEEGPQTPQPSPLPLHLESEDDLLPLLLDEFPHLHLSEHTWHELWRRGLNQIEALTRAHQEGQRKKTRAQCQLEDAAHRHELLADIMKKQMEHTKRVRDVKEQKQQQISTRNKMHEKRIQSARARRYYNDYQVRARSKQLKRRTKEEMVFRDLFRDALSIQKERIRDVRQYATDQRKKQESRRQDEIDSLENFYHDQFEMLAEKLTREQKETEVRDAAQQQIMQRLKRELRNKMESEIKQYQEQLFRDDDDVHFRKCDADRVLKQLQLARYSAKI